MAPSPRTPASSYIPLPSHRAFPASQHPRRLRRPRAGWRRRIGAPLAALLGVAVFIVATKGGREARTAESLLPSLDVTASWLGLGVDQVSLTGHRFTPDGDIFDALQLDRQRMLIGFDTAGARARIEKLAWVASVDIVRDYPGRLDVRVTERKPFAVWSKGEREFLIDRTGRVLQAVPAGSVANLPRLAGEGAEREAGMLLALVGRHPPLAERFARAGGY